MLDAQWFKQSAPGNGGAGGAGGEVTGKVHGRARQASGGSAAGNNNAAQCTQPPGGQALHLASRASRLTRIRFPWLACLACLVEFLLHLDLDAVTRTCTHTRSPSQALTHKYTHKHISAPNSGDDIPVHTLCTGACRRTG